MSLLTIKPGGKLVAKEWEYPNWVYTDVTDRSAFFLNKELECIEEGVTLRDVFSLMEPNKEFYSILFDDCFFNDFLEAVTTKKASRPSDLEYLKVSRDVTVVSTLGSNEVEIGNMASFDGIGYDEQDCTKLTRYALDLSEVEDLADVPIKLDLSLNFLVGSNHHGDAVFSLYDFLLAIIWELSFVGKPGSQQELRDSITKQIEDIKSGNVELHTMDDVMAELGINKEKDSN
jgi:hypothetical protein